MNESLKDLVGDILDTSEFLHSAELLKQKKDKGALFEGGIRHLSTEEIETLEAQGNHSLSWAKVKVKEGFTADLIKRNTFAGECVLET